MALVCNIDAAGKAARLKSGIIGTLGGVFIGAITLAGVVQGPVWWMITAGALFGGAFAIFEARAGWCVLRAMGIRTPL
ncbi:MAG: hypothetical protein OSA38_01125 [Candidatus Poseidoniaceae archaeon]|nr:hypothetical protein [Candidatus Poseidoniaceae archaeon]|tara:strand:+ start:76 stop:309 length:234 start_codon:yes stop_codon:yes gene_type:complete